MSATATLDAAEKITDPEARLTFLHRAIEEIEEKIVEVRTAHGFAIHRAAAERAVRAWLAGEPIPRLEDEPPVPSLTPAQGAEVARLWSATEIERYAFGSNDGCGARSECALRVGDATFSLVWNFSSSGGWIDARVHRPSAHARGTRRGVTLSELRKRTLAARCLATSLPPALAVYYLWLVGFDLTNVGCGMHRPHHDIHLNLGRALAAL